MSRVIWTESAVADLGRHYDFLKPNSPNAAARAVQMIVQAGESLEQNSRRGAIVDKVAGLRKLLVFLANMAS